MRRILNRYRRIVQSSIQFVIRSIVTHVFSGRWKTPRDRWRARRATLNKKSNHWSLPPSRSEEDSSRKYLDGNTSGVWHLDTKEILLLSDFVPMFRPPPPSFSFFSFFLYKLRLLSYHHAFFTFPRTNECFLLVAFSDYHIVLPLVVFSREDAVLQFRGRTVSRDNFNSKLKWTAFVQINSHPQKDVTKAVLSLEDEC